MSRRLMPAVVNQACSAGPDSASGRPEAKPSRPMLRMRQLRPGTAAASVGIVDGVRRVVGEALVAVDRATLQPLAQRGRDELVVDAPAHVVAAVRPPRVVLALGVQCAVTVHPAALDQAVEPAAFLRQATGILLVGLPVP